MNSVLPTSTNNNSNSYNNYNLSNTFFTSTTEKNGVAGNNGSSALNNDSNSSSYSIATPVMSEQMYRSTPALPTYAPYSGFYNAIGNNVNTTVGAGNSTCAGSITGIISATSAVSTPVTLNANTSV